jgi:hypothetical protein
MFGESFLAEPDEEDNFNFDDFLRELAAIYPKLKFPTQ